MVSCSRLIESYLSYSEEHFECEVKGQYIVLTAPFTYFDGDHIQVFVRDASDGTLEISDLGHAVRKLNASGIQISRARSRQSRIDVITRSRGVEFDRGRLYTYCELSDFAESLMNLIQAMLQTDDMALSRSIGGLRTFASEIEDEIKSFGIGYRKSVRLPGEFGNRSHDFDFQLELPVLTVIKGLSAVSNYGADDQANRLLGAIADIRPRNPDFRPLVVLDDDTDVSWIYAEGILSTVTQDVYRLRSDHERFKTKLKDLQESAA